MPNSTTALTGQTWCLDPRPLLPLVARFTDHLASLGHTTLTVGNYGDAARHFLVWLQRSGIAVARVDVSTCGGFANHQCRCPGIRRSDRVSAKYACRASRFVRFLSECGVVGSLASPDPAPVERRVALFQAWLRQHRGIAERTIDRHGRMIARLQVALGTDPAGYTAASIRQVVLNELRGTSVAYVKTMTTALRGYLRFLGASGACRLELIQLCRSGGCPPCRVISRRPMWSGRSRPAMSASRMASATGPFCSCWHVSGFEMATCSICA